MNDLATNPQGDAAVADNQVSFEEFAEGVENDAQNTDTDTDTDEVADETEEPDEGQAEVVDDSVEVEYEGKTLRVPAEVKDALLRQADYTQKTQALAATRQELEQRQQAFTQQVQTQTAFAKELGEYSALSAQIANLDPGAIAQLAAEDPGQAMQYQLQRQALLEQQSALGRSITQKQQQIAIDEQRTIAKQVEEGRQVLQRDIPGWNDSVAGEVANFGQKQYGFTAAEIGQVVDPRMIKVLHDAQQWRAHQTKTATAAKIAKAQQTAPVQTARGQSGRFSAPPDTTDFAAFEKLAAKG